VRDVESGKGEALREFVAHLNPATPEDRDLLEMMLLTPFWGGEPGARPAFILQSQGRGCGKTSTAQAIGSVYGGAVGIQAKERWQRVVERLLSDNALTSRVVVIDNLTGKFESPELAAMITAKTIDGRKMYVGNASRLNLITWIITANDPSLSTDLAARAVVIKIGRAQHKVDFHGWLSAFLEERGDELLGDIQARLQGPSLSRYHPDRFLKWQEAVLSKFKNGRKLAALIEARREEVDEEGAEAGEASDAIRIYIRLKLKEDPKTWEGRITPAQLFDALRGIWPDVSGFRAMWTRLGPLIGLTGLSNCRQLRGGREGRGMLWKSRK